MQICKFFTRMDLLHKKISVDMKNLANIKKVNAIEIKEDIKSNLLDNFILETGPLGKF